MSPSARVSAVVFSTVTCRPFIGAPKPLARAAAEEERGHVAVEGEIEDEDVLVGA